MSTPSKKDIIRLRLVKARTTLSEAEKMLEYNFVNAALNRLYYACFYAATALLLSKGVLTKTHSGVKQMLGLHFISTGIITNELGRFYGEIFTQRMSSDYDDFASADFEMVKEFSLIADEFVSTTQKILEL